MAGKYTYDSGYKKRSRAPFVMAMLLPAAALLGGAMIFVQTPEVETTDMVQAEVTESPEAVAVEHRPRLQLELPWPAYGQAAYGVVNEGVVSETESAAKPVPIASLTKVITALAVLEKKPIMPGTQGPLITLTHADVAIYEHNVSVGGSYVPVRAGMEITQYQALQAMMLPSSNNIADTLAIWAFGSEETYLEYANDMLARKGLVSTRVGDASGFSPNSVSTAGEMVELGMLYIADPVLLEIASQERAELPYAGFIENLNDSINDEELLGIKIGYTDEAKKTFLLAHFPKDNSPPTVAAVFGAEDWLTLLEDTRMVIRAGNEEYSRHQALN